MRMTKTATIHGLGKKWLEDYDAFREREFLASDDREPTRSELYKAMDEDETEFEEER